MKYKSKGKNAINPNISIRLDNGYYYRNFKKIKKNVLEDDKKNSTPISDIKENSKLKSTTEKKSPDIPVPLKKPFVLHEFKFIQPENEKAKNEDLPLVLKNDNKLIPPVQNNSLLDILFNNIKKDKKQSEEIIEKSTYILGDDLIENKIETLHDLIQIANEYEDKFKNSEKKFNIDIEQIFKLKEPLDSLQNMIGLDNVKEQIFNQIIYYLQHLDDHNHDMLHTVIQGTPGMGKTELAKILAKIYNHLGILSKGTFKSVKRSDLIGCYLGQTAMKTQQILEESKGGVLFIDEAYSLGNNDGKDTYSKECIDTITSYLSENREDFVCIIAGYKDDLERCFFKYNNGLERRFPWKYTLESYSVEELWDIFCKIVHDHNWNIDKILLDNFSEIKHLFEKNKDLFTNNGGDMELLFQKAKLIHSKCLLSGKSINKKYLDINNITEAIDLLIESKRGHTKKRKFGDSYLDYLYS